MLSPRSARPLLALAGFSLAAFSQQPPSPPADQDKLVQLSGIDVKGTRLPGDSIIRLSGLKLGQQINYRMVDEACRKITSTGLIKTINYGYQVQPDRPGVVLSLRIVDESPLLPAKILPAEDTEKIWGCLQAADSIFTRELPNTKGALAFYKLNIERCITSHGQTDAYVSPSVACDAKGVATQIVFDIRAKLPGPAAR